MNAGVTTDAALHRLIGWEWQPQDRPPHWCPRRGAAR
jgi:hypothetical protein